jgi:hypothetical protein
MIVGDIGQQYRDSRRGQVEENVRQPKQLADSDCIPELPRKVEPQTSHEKSQTQEMPIVTRLSTVKTQPIEWLWPRWIPLNAITILDGDPGDGKSTMALDIGARVTRGTIMPPDTGTVPTRPPADVLVLSAEDDVARIIRPRLEVAGADMCRVHSLGAIQITDSERPVILPEDLAHVEKIVVERSVALVIIDPVMAYLSGDIDSHKDQDIRRLMHALAKIAERTRAAILIIRHFNKLAHSVAIYRGGGSIGITGASRSALAVGHDPNNVKMHVLAPVKCNLCPMPRSLLYTIEPDGDVSRIGWAGETDLTANDILSHPEAKGKKTAGDQCAEDIRDLLTDGAAMGSSELEQRLRAMGHALNAIRQGRKLAKVKAYKEGFGSEGPWMVRIPEDKE